MALDSAKVIDGSFGTIYEGPDWLTNFMSGELVTDITYEEIKRAGSRAIGNKATTVKHSGTISGYKITSELAQRVAQINDDTKGALVTELTMRLSDPTSYGYESVRIKGVQFTKIDVMKFEHGTVVEQEWPFVCDGYEWLNPITKK